MRQSQGLEWKVGLFVFVSLAVFAVMILYFSDANVWNRGYELKVHFKFTNGLQVGAPVRYSGVDIGKVEDILILNNGTLIELRLRIDDGVQLREDVDVFINTLGVMGEKYLEITGGSQGAAIIGEGWQPLMGTNPVSVNEMAAVGQTIATELKEVVVSVRQIVGTEEARMTLKDTLVSVEQTVGNINSLVQNIDGLVTDNRVNFYKTLDELKQSSEQLNTLLSGINEGQGFVGKMLQEEQMYEDLRHLVADVKANPWKLVRKTKEKPIDLPELAEDPSSSTDDASESKSSREKRLPRTRRSVR